SKRALFSFSEDWENYPESQPELFREIGAIKTKSIDSAIEITDLAMKVVGGVGLEKSRPLERYFRDVRSGLFNPPIEGRALEQLAAAVLD
ncbi:MAG: acyl-CoA dehydrogenase family protein, partial [Dehalococcoidia bacterium]|nr:acyl-CoA dehydrogenase family protein [Dehalococcoidia bacterium]